MLVSITDHEKHLESEELRPVLISSHLIWTNGLINITGQKERINGQCNANGNHYTDLEIPDS